MAWREGDSEGERSRALKPALHRRADDIGWMCVAAQRLREFWDWIDKRQIDAYAISLAILFGTVRITDWAMDFVDNHPDVDGLKAAAIMAAVMAPWSALQGAALKFLFEARQKSFLTQPAEYSATSTTTATVKAKS